MLPIQWNPDRKTLADFSEAAMFALGMVAAPLAYYRGQPKVAVGFWVAAVVGRLIGLARAHLAGRLRHKVDPEDVVQSAYKSFLLRYGEQARAADGWDRLWGVLTTITPF